MFLLWHHWSFWAFMVPMFVLCLIASFVVQATFRRYLRIAARSGFTGAEAARRILDTYGLQQASLGNPKAANKLKAVRIQVGSGMLTDYYNPLNRTLVLSPPVMESNSLAALGVAAHEAGHAIQHATGYLPLGLRSAVVPAANIGSQGGPLLFILGLLLGRSPLLMDIGIGLFALSVFFYFITLPVEINASSRAIKLLGSSGIVAPGEVGAVRKVLTAAAFTYLAAALMALAQLLVFLMIRRER